MGWVKIRAGSPTICILVPVGLLWLTLLVGDWWMRFHWFAWHRTLIRQENLVVTSPVRPMTVRECDEMRGGNLSGMIAIPGAAKAFEQSRPAFIEYYDEYGFPNKPPTTNTCFPVVLTGDSFMMVPDRMEDRIDAQLQAEAGLPVYNHSVKGRGAFEGLIRFLQSERFDCEPPQILIWGIVEMDISAGTYVGLLSRLAREVKPRHLFQNQMPVHTKFVWKALSPRTLRTSLPNSSATAQLSRKIWNMFRYYIFGQITPDVIVAEGQVAGRPVLFYRYALDAMRWPTSVRDVDRVVWVLQELQAFCREKDVELVVLLIPDKEQVYRNLIPFTYRSDVDTPIPASCLWAIESGLQTSGIPCVNLIGPFREKAKEDVLLYWLDDTHWNPEGIQIAAELLWETIAPMLSNSVMDAHDMRTP